MSTKEERLAEKVAKRKIENDAKAQAGREMKEKMKKARHRVCEFEPKNDQFILFFRTGLNPEFWSAGGMSQLIFRKMLVPRLEDVREPRVRNDKSYDDVIHGGLISYPNMDKIKRWMASLKIYYRTEDDRPTIRQYADANNKDCK